MIMTNHSPPTAGTGTARMIDSMSANVVIGIVMGGPISDVEARTIKIVTVGVR